MKYFMVFGSKKRPQGFMGGKYLDWSEPPIGVYGGENADEACKAAAKDSDNFGTFFAIEGMPWGVELMTPEATQFGRTKTAEEMMADRLDRMDEIAAQLAAASAPQLEAGND